MKKFIIAFTLSLSYLLANTAMAVEARSLRTATGDLIQLGDSEASVRQKIADVSGRNYDIRIDGKRYSATDFSFKVDNTAYTVTIVNNKVHKIEWHH